MNLGTRMAGDETDDPLDLGRIEPLACIDPALAEDVETERPVGVDHDLDDARVGECGGDRRTHGGAKHGAATIVGGAGECNRAHRA